MPGCAAKWGEGMPAKLLTGKEVAAAINKRTMDRIRGLKERGIKPTIAFLRVGDKEDDIAYENSAMRRCDQMGISYRLFHIDRSASQEELMSAIEEINSDDGIHGVLMLRPLPHGFDEKAACAAISAHKDIDGITNSSLAGIFTGEKIGYPPCTAQAVLEILKYYGIPIDSKRVVVVGRSLVIGRPAALMLLGENATVTICHTHTKDLPSICQQADILVAAAGALDVVDTSCFNRDMAVIDVGIHIMEDGKMRGDVDWRKAQDCVAAITPVPGGVGTVTTAVLMSHLADAAVKASLHI